MKKIISLSIGVLFYANSFSQLAPQQVDTINIQIIDSIYSRKSSFIGRPFADLIDAVGKSISFSIPDSAGNRTKGMAYYDNPLIFLSHPPGVASRGFRVVFTQKMPVDLGKRKAVGLDQWDILMRTYLRPAIVAEIERIY